MGQIIQILKTFNRVIRFSYPFHKYHKYECCKVYRTGTLIKEEYLSNSGNFFGLPFFSMETVRMMSGGNPTLPNIHEHCAYLHEVFKVVFLLKINIQYHMLFHSSNCNIMHDGLTF